jgi:hypothetical protein
MALRPAYNLEASRKLMERLGALLWQIYLFWLLGIAVGALKLQPTSLSVAGASFSISRPELVEGFLYLACFFLYAAGLYRVMIHPYAPTRNIRLRHAIYSAAIARGKTFKGKTSEELLVIRKQARDTYRVLMAIGMFGVFLPLLHMLALRYAMLWTTIKALWG